ncbi:MULTISPECIES: MogA/MoaB family molybdenum cofactor biosynthesis protein [Staphylococcus]|uniref:Molybdenum cofactor biosynthesis protein B n=1 Tax=Staphylococcus hsinchuensis TaxID=3051183 RepID=A0ABZ3EDN8_9STAP|nr:MULTISPECIES: molybdenum cofactor biosynthesis protein B [unclassified Staphylococcus]
MHHNETLKRNIKCAVLTISDTRDVNTDKGGQLIQNLLSESDMTVDSEIHYVIVKDEIDAIQQQLQEWLAQDVDVIITTGGTGIAERDVTIEAIEPYLTKEIEGFGELFRYLSYVEDVGSRAMLSRAIGGTIKDKLIFCLPGSTGAIKLAMNRLIIPEVNHLISEIRK